MQSAILGAGFAASLHAEALQACGIPIAAVCASREESAKTFATRFGIPAWGTDPALLCAEDIDVVHVCTPPALHAEQIRRLLAAGKHILCEKPLALQGEEAASLAAEAADSGLLAGLVYNVRAQEACRKARELLQSGSLGKLLLIHGSYLQEFHALPSPKDWRYDPALAGEMRAVTEIGSHWLDLAQYLTGSHITALSALFQCAHPERILHGSMMYPADSAKNTSLHTTSRDSLHAETSEPLRVDSEDAAALLLRFDNGAIGNVFLSEISAGRGNHLAIEITGEDGSLWWNEEDSLRLYTARKGEGIRTELSAFGGGYADTFRTLFREFYTAAETGNIPERPLWATFEEGAQVAALCDAAFASACSGGSWKGVCHVPDR